MDNVFEVARLAGVKRVGYASFIAVSDQQSHSGERLVTEDDPVYGTSQYAVHKIFNEFQAWKYIKNDGMSITSVRPANVTGPDKVRGSTDHVELMVDAAHSRPVHAQPTEVIHSGHHATAVRRRSRRPTLTLSDFSRPD